MPPFVPIARAPPCAVEGHSTPGGYSSKAVKPIALAKCMQIAQVGRRGARRAGGGLGKQQAATATTLQDDGGAACAPCLPGHTT